jgi:hypothetical protein
LGPGWRLVSGEPSERPALQRTAGFFASAFAKAAADKPLRMTARRESCETDEEEWKCDKAADR